MWLFPPFRLDPVNQRLWRVGDVVSIQPKAFAVLRYLVERPERLVTRQELLSAIWPDVHVDPGVVKTHINQIRRALQDSVNAPQFLETVPRHGYRFVAATVEERAALIAPDTAPARGGGSRASRSKLVVGRAHERECLERALGRSLAGQRQVMFVTGDAGMGKTALVNSFLEPFEDGATLAVARGHCVEQPGAGEPYLPLVEGLNRLARGGG
jgi:DNA-binding winged helix-turn-helix (wHTH) protein